MSERMTDEECFRRASKAADDADPADNDMEARGFARADFSKEEAMRARASEDQKDSVIKALADALLLLKKNRALLLDEEHVAIDSALRLAGRL